MSWIELDDQILEHPKFIRIAKRKEGEAALFLWLGLRAYCSQKLTDGFIPEDMLDEVRGPRDKKKRQAALAALVDERLLVWCDGGVRMHDYLDWSRSKSQVLADRDRARDRQAKSRGRSRGESRRDSDRTDGVSSDGVTMPSASASASPPTTPTTNTRARDARVVAPDVPEVPAEPEPDPGRETVCPTDLPKRLETNGTMAAIAEKLAIPIESVRHEIQQFAAYWTIGKGAGQRRTNWPGKARQWVVDQHGKPGGLKAVGAIEHDSRNPADARPPPVAPSRYLESFKRATGAQ